MTPHPPTAHAPTTTSIPPWADPWRYPQYYDGVMWRRVCAYLIDVFILSALGCLVFPLLALLTFSLFFVPFFSLWPLLYATLMVALPGAATLGMRAMGIRVFSLSPHADDTGHPTLLQAAIQSVGFYGSLLLTGSIILLVPLFNPRHRTLHDWMSGTVVARTLPNHQESSGGGI